MTLLGTLEPPVYWLLAPWLLGLVFTMATVAFLTWVSRAIRKPAGPAAPREDDQTVRLALGPQSGEAVCPFCRQPLLPVTLESTIRCSACEVRHHVECWGEHGGCSVLGCRRDARLKQARA